MIMYVYIQLCKSGIALDMHFAILSAYCFVISQRTLRTISYSEYTFFLQRHCVVFKNQKKKIKC